MLSDMSSGDFMYDVEIEDSEGWKVKLPEHRLT